MRALVLSGGGAKGAYQVGVLKRWLVDEGREYDILCGISVGALNSAALAQVRRGDPKEAYHRLSGLWDRVENRKVRKWWFGWYLAALWKPSVYDSTPLEKWVAGELNPAQVAASGRKLRIGAVSWDTGRYHVADETSDRLRDWVVASASFPGFFKPVKIDGEEWTDGGVRNVTPLGEAIRAGADEIDVIMTSNPDRLKAKPWAPPMRSALFRAARALDLAVEEVMRGDLKECGLKNDLAELGAAYKHVKVTLQQPSVPIEGDALDFDPAKVREMREFGYHDAGRG